MQKIDIGKLLSLVLCGEPPKGHPIIVTPWDIITDCAQLERCNGLAPRHGACGGDIVPGGMHPDAYVIAEAIRGLPAATRLGVVQSEQPLRHYAALDVVTVKAVAKAVF